MAENHNQDHAALKMIKKTGHGIRCILNRPCCIWSKIF